MHGCVLTLDDIIDTILSMFHVLTIMQSTVIVSFCKGSLIFVPSKAEYGVRFLSWRKNLVDPISLFCFGNVGVKTLAIF